MSSFSLVGNSITISTVSNSTSTGGWYQPITTYPAVSSVQYAQHVENGLIPEVPEAWLRRRVREVCELAA